MPRSSSRPSRAGPAASPAAEKLATRHSARAMASPSPTKGKSSPAASKAKATPLSAASTSRGRSAAKSEPLSSTPAAKSTPPSRSRSQASSKKSVSAVAKVPVAKSPAASRSRSRAAEKPATQKSPAVKSPPTSGKSRSRVTSTKSTPPAKSRASPAASKARSTSRVAAKTKVATKSPKKVSSPSPKKACATKKVTSRGRSATRKGKKAEEEEEAEKEEEEENVKEEAKEDETDEAKQDEGTKSDSSDMPETKTSASESEAVSELAAKPAEQSEDTKVGDDTDNKMDTNKEEVPKDETPKEAEQDSVEMMEVEAVPASSGSGGGLKRKRMEEEDEETADGLEAKVMKVSDESNGVDVVAKEVGDIEDDKPSVTAVESSSVIEPAAPLSKDDLTATEDSELDGDYILISTDDVPAANNDEVTEVASQMTAVDATDECAVVAAANGENSESCGGSSSSVDDPVLSRTFVANSAVTATVVGSRRTFSVVSYNILADCHAQKDFTGDSAPWISDEELAVTSRHKRLLEELIYLDGDVICLQEVGGDYLSSLLLPALEGHGYKGVFIPRNTKAYCEGEATFYRTNRFSLVSSEGLVLGDLINAAVDESSGLEPDKKELVKSALATHAVAMVTRLKAIDVEDCVTVANIHVAYDSFERQDRQCVQIATAVQKLVESAGGADKPHVICGDFNSWPGSPPYQLMTDGALNETSLVALQGIEKIDGGEEQFLPVVNLWTEGFQFPIGGDLKSSYLTVLGEEPPSSRFASKARVLSVDYIWYSSVALELLGVLKVVDRQLIEPGIPSAVFPSDHLSIKAQLAFK